MGTRRYFIKKSTLAALSAIAGANIVFGKNMPREYQPLFLDDPYELFGKDRNMVLLNDRPWNMEAQAHLLDDLITPSEKMFIRNNGFAPKNIEASKWSLTVEGESARQKKVFSLQELKSKFKHYTFQLTLECGGNGRSEFDPPAKGNQWTIGAVGCAEWTGIRLKDVLNNVGYESDAVYIGYYGADKHLSGDEEKVVISRGVPIRKAMEDETLLAFKMNGEDIPLAHGFPLRLVVGGWPASASGKWLNKLVIRNQEHDGPKMGGQSYRVPCHPVAPGTRLADEDMCIIESMPVKSLITFPKTGLVVAKNKEVNIRGKAWAGDLEVIKMEYSINFGSSWHNCELAAPKNKLAWQAWSTKIKLPETGYYEIWARATDSNGMKQPMLLPGWNPKGYLNNACHRIAVKAI